MAIGQHFSISPFREREKRTHTQRETERQKKRDRERGGEWKYMLKQRNILMSLKPCVFSQCKLWILVLSAPPHLQDSLETLSKGTQLSISAQYRWQAVLTLEIKHHSPWYNGKGELGCKLSPARSPSIPVSMLVWLTKPPSPLGTSLSLSLPSLPVLSSSLIMISTF